MRAILSVGVALSLVFSIAAPAYAAGGIVGNLTGTVRDASTQAPIADVQVSAASPSGSFSGTTDAAGRFSLLGLPADTYTVSFTKAGYDSVSEQGVAVFGDETDSVGTVRLNKTLKTIAHTFSRARNSAFQPSQTQDVTTISGARITQAIGYSTNQNEQNLILAAPGTIQDTSGNISLRGSMNVELGYQYDGVNFSGVFFDENASQGFLSNITGGSGGSLQVVSGSGDATQGNIGAGVINLVPPRGTYPASGQLSASVGEPFFDHEFSGNYGFATPNNRISDFLSYDGDRFTPLAVTEFPYGASSENIGNYGGLQYEQHDSLVNNLVFRFGHQNDMSLQWLLRADDLRAYGNYGETLPSPVANYYINNPLYYGSYVNNYITGLPEWAGCNTEAVQAAIPNPGGPPLTCTAPMSPLQQFQSVDPIIPGTPTDGSLPTSPQESDAQPLSFNKIAFTWNLSPSTFLSLSYANLYLISAQNINTYSGNPAGAAAPQDVFNGGQRLADELDLTHQFGDNHTTTLAVRYEDALPIWEQSSPWFTNIAESLYNPNGLGAYGVPVAFNPGDEDWYLPANTNAPVNMTHGANYNPCIGPDATGAPMVDPTGCYIYDYMQQNGLWNGTLPQEPMGGLNYHHTIFHESGVGIRDQWTVSSRLHLDYGLREDMAEYDFGANLYGNGKDAYSNPSDVQPSNISDFYMKPHFLEPRFAASYLLDANDSLRFSYGRSVEFPFAQTAGTPWDMPLANPLYGEMPSKDSAAGIAILNAAGAGIDPSTVGPACGSGVDTQTYPSTGGLWFCNAPGAAGSHTGYAQENFWLGDQNLDAPDLGGTQTPSFNNFDLAWSHGFTHGKLDGFGVKMTAFARHGYNAGQDIVLKYGAPNPVTGQETPSVFTVANNGVERTTGLEFMLTAPDRPYGWNGFLTMNYISQFENVPPVASGGSEASDSLPLVGAAILRSGEFFRSGYLPPFQGRFSLSYTTQSGWKFNPIVSFDGGYPVGAGTQTYNEINGAYVWFPSSSLAGASPVGGSITPYAPYNDVNYVDPAYTGSLLNPNIIGSRWSGEPALPGGTLTKPHAGLDFDLEYSPHGSPWTMGMYIANVFNENLDPTYVTNTQYQPLANGLAGPQSGESAAAWPTSASYANGARDQFVGNLPYSPYNSLMQEGTNINFYLQRKL